MTTGHLIPDLQLTLAADIDFHLLNGAIFHGTAIFHIQAGTFTFTFIFLEAGQETGDDFSNAGLEFAIFHLPAIVM